VRPEPLFPPRQQPAKQNGTGIDEKSALSCCVLPWNEQYSTERTVIYHGRARVFIGYPSMPVANNTREKSFGSFCRRDQCWKAHQLKSILNLSSRDLTPVPKRTENDVAASPARVSVFGVFSEPRMVARE
jgi:hypothetical protein